MAKRTKRKVPRGELPRSNRYLELLSDELKREIIGERTISHLSKGEKHATRYTTTL